MTSIHCTKCLPVAAMDGCSGSYGRYGNLPARVDGRLRRDDATGKRSCQFLVGFTREPGGIEISIASPIEVGPTGIRKGNEQ